MKKKFCLTILLIITLTLSAKEYKINSVKSFYKSISNFIKSSKGKVLQKLKPIEIYNLTITLSRNVKLVDDFQTDSKDYLQPIITAMENYKSLLSSKSGKFVSKTSQYLDDLEQDIINQNKSDVAGGTKTFKFDIDNFSGDTYSNYEIKKIILKGNTKKTLKLIPQLSKIDKELIQRINVLKIKKLDLKFATNISQDFANALLLFKGDNIILKNVKYIAKPILRMMIQIKPALELKKLYVNDKNIEILTSFQTKELKITGLVNKYNTKLKKALGKRYRKEIRFKKKKRY